MKNKPNKNKDKTISETKRERRRNYGNDYPSVTEVLSVIRKPALEMWFKMNSKEECDRLSKKARDIGSQIHSLIESYIKGKEGHVKTKYQNEVNTGLKSFLKFRTDNPHIKLQWAEQPVKDIVLKINGTIDCIGVVDDKLVIIDWKTSECKEKEKPEIYFEYILQVAQYYALWNYGGLWDRPDMHTVHSAYIVVLAKDKVCYTLKKLNKEILNKASDIFECLIKYFHQRKALEKELKKEEKETINGI